MNGKNESPFLLSDDGWIHVTPIGEFPHHVGVVQVIDRRACDLMADDFAKRRKEEGDRFAGLLVDYDHFSLDTEKPSEAAGWLTELEARDDGLWGRVRWTDAGLAAVTGGRYRFVSAVFPAASELEWVDEAARKGRPVRLVSIALTNEPNIKGGKPIANREKKDATAGTEGATASPDEKKIPGVAVGGDGAAKYMWLAGATKSGTHCPECAARHGQVKTLLEWMRMPAPYCECACHLARVGVAAT